MATTGRFKLSPTLLNVGIAAGVAFLLYKFGKQLLDQIGKGADAASKSAANAYVNATAGPVIQVAPGNTFTLPNGARINPQLTVPLGGGVFSYLGVKYKLVAASPPGSGNYTAAKV